MQKLREAAIREMEALRKAEMKKEEQLTEEICLRDAVEADNELHLET